MQLALQHSVVRHKLHPPHLLFTHIMWPDRSPVSHQEASIYARDGGQVCCSFPMPFCKEKQASNVDVTLILLLVFTELQNYTIWNITQAFS